MASTATALEQQISPFLRYAAKILRPLVRTFLRTGVSADQINELVRWLYVDEFYKQSEFWNRDRPFGSRAALMTGLSRKEVSRLRQIEEPDETMLTTQQNRAARVLAGWVNDERFHQDGKPAVLPLSAKGKMASFDRLVQLYSGDLPTRTVLDELRRSGCVTTVDDEVRLLQQAYGPCGAPEVVLNAAGLGIQRLAETVDFNIANNDSSDRRLQRVWYQCNIPADRVAEARQIISDEAVAAGREIDRKLARLATPKKKAAQGYSELGLGMYYYEAD